MRANTRSKHSKNFSFNYSIIFALLYSIVPSDSKHESHFKALFIPRLRTHSQKMTVAAKQLEGSKNPMVLRSYLSFHASYGDWENQS